MKILHMDNGGEYTDKAFTGFCATEGIRREWKTLYDSQQNWVAEQKNIMIVGLTKEMLYD